MGTKREIFFVLLFVALYFTKVINTQCTWYSYGISESRYSLSATSVGKLSLFAGGINSTGNSNRVDIFNHTSREWTVSYLSAPRYNIAATTVGTLAIFGGGSIDGGEASDTVDIYNSITGQWFTETLSKPRTSLSATSSGSLAFFAGGANTSTSSNMEISNSIDVYDATNGQWSVMYLPGPRMDLAAASYQDIVLFAGGWTGTSYASEVFIYNITSQLWTTAYLSSNHRAGLSNFWRRTQHLGNTSH